MNCLKCGKKLGKKNKTNYCSIHRDLSPERRKWKKENRERNKEKEKERDKKRYRENPNRKKLADKYRKENRELINFRRREDRKQNPEKYKETRSRKEYLKKRYDTEPIFRLRSIISSSFKNWNKNKKSSTFLITGYSKEDYFSLLKERFEKDFPKLEFEVCVLSGEYHIDHIIPVSFAKTDKYLIELYNPINLRLIPAKENLEKQGKIVKNLIDKYNLSELYLRGEKQW